MPYLFLILVLANAALFGYMRFMPNEKTIDPSVEQARSQLQQPVKFINNADEIPPLIGEK